MIIDYGVNSLGFVFFLVSFLDDPSNELFGLFSGFWQQFEGDHVKHLDCLI